MAFSEVEWVLEGGLIAPGERVDTKRLSTLRCLEFVWWDITGSRRCAKPKGPQELASMDDILEGLTVEAYAEVLEGWQLVPNRFF